MSDTVITIIGTGNMARALAARAVMRGSAVEIVGRDRAKAAALAAALGGGATAGEWGAAPAGDIVVLALLADGIVPTVAHYGDALAGKVVIDISNPFNQAADGLTHSGETSIAQQAAEIAPASTQLIKGFNTIFRHVLEQGRPDVFFAGDDADAKARVAGFIEGLGLRPVDVGALKMAHWLEGAGLLTMGVARFGVGGWDFSLGVAGLRG
jgi:predicted dinucleotide-binding enzyme